MALKVRDEGDILEANLRFHHALGVDHFIVTDNGSTDETMDILGRYEKAGLVTVINEPRTRLPGRGRRMDDARWPVSPPPSSTPTGSSTPTPTSSGGRSRAR